MDDTDRERLALQVFSEICELSEPARSETLEARCASDSILRERVESLLKADGKALEPLAPKAVERFLQTEVGHAAQVAIKPEARPESLGSDYRLLRVLGEGGMATVYEAEQQHPRRLVAIKIVRGGSFAPQLRRRFEYEAQILARLQHPNIAQLYEADTQPDGANVCAYLAMELVRGIPIDEFAESKHLGIRDRVKLVLRVCDAVEYAHQMGVLHRDLKPANILVQEDGQPKILDFGVARAIDRDERLATVLTSAGQVIGTLPYMSPELVEGNGFADTRADVYALGVLLYKLFTGQMPVNVSDCGIAEAARRICQNVPPPPSQFERSLRGDLDVIVCKALEKDAERRYRSVHALATDLRRFLDGRAIEARVGSSFYVMRKTLWRYRRIAAVAGAFVGILIAFAVLAEIQSRHNKELARQAVVARDVAARNADELRRSLYLSNIGFAQAALETNDIGHVSPLLEGCPPDLRGWEWGYLRALSDRSETTWQMKTHQPRSVDMSADHTRIAIGCDAEVSVLDGTNRELLFSRTFSDGPVAVALSRDGRYLAAGPWMDEMCFVDLKTGKELWTTPPATKPAHPLLRRLRALCFSPDGATLAMAGYDGHIRFRDIATGSVRRDIDAQCLSVLCIAFTSDGRSIVCGDDRGRLRMWRIDDGSILHDSTPHDGSVACVAISPDGSTLASGASDGRVIVRKLSDWSEIKTLPAGKAIVWSVAFSPDGKTIAAGSDDNLLRLWKLGDDSAPSLLRGHADTIYYVTFDSAGHTLVSAGADANVKNWNLDRIDPPDTISIEGAATFATAFTHDGSGVIIVCNDGSVRLWDRANWNPRWRYNGARTTLRSIATNDRNSRIAVCGDDATIRILDTTDGSELQMLKLDATSASAVAFSPDGSVMVTADGDGWIRAWNVQTLPAKPLTSIHAHSGNVMAMALHPDGMHVATGGSDGTVKLWSIDKPQPLATVRPDGTAIHDLCFNSSGTTLACAYADGAIWILEGDSLHPQHELRGHQGAVNGLAFQSGTSRLASGGADRTIRIWDVSGGAQILTLRGHRRPLEHLAFSRDGATLASTSLDGTVQLWDSQIASSKSER